MWRLLIGEDKGKEFAHSDDLIKYYREEMNADEDNDTSDDFIFDEALALGEFEEVKKIDDDGLIVTVFHRYDINGAWTHDIDVKVGKHLENDENSMWRPVAVTRLKY